MTSGNEELELKDRLNLIETMIAEGRRTTERYGWTFVLWGVAYYIAIFWAGVGRDYLAWPITMTVAGVLTGFLFAKTRCKRPVTTIARAIGSIWIAMGISMFVLFMALGCSGRLMDYHIFVAIAAAMLGAANATSSMTLKWKLQFVCALVWWTAAVVSCFGSASQSSISFLVAIFLCQIVFGGYMMIAEACQRGKVAPHA
jgi:hypothetical protein